MIKAGDKVILDGVEYFVNDIRSGSVSLYKERNPLSVMFMNEKTLYVKLYEQQKQRADELEKRWSELKDKVDATSIFLGTTGRMDSYIMYIHILDIMQRLEEDDNA